MNRENKEKEGSHYVRIDEQRCNGCILCMKACPTKAIRVRKGVARIQGACVDCGECFKACPRGAIKVTTTISGGMGMRPFTAVSVSPVLYTQFGKEVMPNDVLLALLKRFNYVYDQSYTEELFNVATELFIMESREKGEGPRPLISPVCPVVNRLIAYRFPTLLKNLLPIMTPREIVARELKKRLVAKGSAKVEEIGVYYITPCPAKMISIKEPILQESSYIDGIFGINEVYEEIRKNLQGLENEIVLHHSSGVGIGWAMSGGEVAGLAFGDSLSVSGIEETIRYLEKIEMGVFTDVDYVEFRACQEGCIGGPMTVVDKYQAKHILQKLIRMYGVEKRVKYAYAKKLYKEGWFFCERKGIPLKDELSRPDLNEAIKRQEAVEKLVRQLPRKECGLCGCPDCSTFAEDVVDGRNAIENCLPYRERMGKREEANES